MNMGDLPAAHKKDIMEVLLRTRYSVFALYDGKPAWGIYEKEISS
jgi:hypothetical protein